MAIKKDKMELLKSGGVFINKYKRDTSETVRHPK